MSMRRVSLYYSVNCGDQFNQGDGFDKAMFGDQRFNINVYGKYKFWQLFLFHVLIQVPVA